MTAALFLLLRAQEITTGVFVCPSAKTEKFPIPRGQNILAFSNFDSAHHLSYSMQNPYPTAEAIQNGFIWNDAMTADAPLLADMNPGGDAVMKIKSADKPDAHLKANSPNHGGEGQNVLYADGHVDWSATVFAGVQNDNIYVHRHPLSSGLDNEPAGIVGPSADDKDAILLPVWDDKIGRPVIDFNAPSAEPGSPRPPPRGEVIQSLETDIITPGQRPG